MDIHKILKAHHAVLAEAAVIEALRRSGPVRLHPRLENALLIYDEAGKLALSRLYAEYIHIARRVDIPMLICTPTWRANRERIRTAQIAADVNGDAVRFLQVLRQEWGPWAVKVFIGGLIGCRNDCYRPSEGLSKQDARDFHSWQIHRLARAGADFLLAATLPAVPEAAGLAQAMAETSIPYVISFVIRRNGTVLDGSSLEQAFCEIDAACSRPPLGYMVNCAYPSFLNAHKQPESVFSRLIGFQANASSLDHEALDGAETLRADAISDWGDRMLELNQRFGIKIIGGCCGTGSRHLQYLAAHLKREQSAGNS